MQCKKYQKWILKMQTKSNCRKKMQKKGNHKWTKNANDAKTQCKTNIIFLKKNVSSKTRIPENDFGHPLDSHLGGVQDMQSRLPGFHAFRFLNLPHMQSVQE